MKLRINKDKKILNLWITQVLVIWLLYANYAIFIFPNYLFPFSIVSLFKIFISALASLLIVALAFCSSILVWKEKEETVLQYKKKIKYNNRIIIGALYTYKYIYGLITMIEDGINVKQIILVLLLLAIFIFILTLPDLIILWLSKKLAFILWENKDCCDKDE
jgi:hypothetical protein